MQIRPALFPIHYMYFKAIASIPLATCLAFMSTHRPSSHVNCELLHEDKVRSAKYFSELHPSPPEILQLLLPSGYFDIVTFL